MKDKFDITPAELLAHKQGSAKRRSAENDSKTAPDAWETTRSEVAALLPPGCTTTLVDNFTGFILGMRHIRIASAQTERSVPETLGDIRQRLLRLLPPWLDYLEANLKEVGELDGLGFGPLYLDQSVLAEINWAKRLLAVVREYPRTFPDRDRVDPDRPKPDWMLQLFKDYQEAFPRGCNGRPTGISQDGPANRFIVAAIKLIGWAPMTPGAVEMMLRRARRRLASYHQMTAPASLKAATTKPR